MASHNEDEYFAREELEKLRKLHHEKLAQTDPAHLAEQKAKFANRCPNCGTEMQKLPALHGVTLLRCFHCGGAFVPPEATGALKQKSSSKEHAVVEAILNWLHHEEK